MLCCCMQVVAQQMVTGQIIDSTTSVPLRNAAVAIQDLRTIIYTDKDGYFSFSTKENKIHMIISKEGYVRQTVEIGLPLQSSLKIILEAKVGDIQEVNISTGYQKIPKERATGSFTVLGNELLNQQVGTSIINRLEAIGNGISIDRSTLETPQLMLRGMSTINGPKSPLIVVDHFPYEGDISNINPDIVDHITLLKDASAASIWGARAANGVIVITTKNGKFNQPIHVELSTSLTLSPKPDFGSIKNINSSDFIDVEQQLFQKGYYDSDISSSNHPALSPVVDLLNKEKKGLLSHEEVAEQIAVLRTIDSKDQYKRYMYQPLENRQYSVNISGGMPKFAWSSALGYDDNSTTLAATYKRANVRFQNIWKPSDRLTVNTALYYTDARTQNGRPGYGGISMKGGNAVPYMQLADQYGNPVAVTKDIDQNFKNSFRNTKLLDWNYYPLSDWQEDRQKTNSTEMMMNFGIQYKVLKGLDADVKYQYQQQQVVSENLHGTNSYFARNYINSFAQITPDGTVTFIVPKGAILDQFSSLSEVHNGRGQVTYNNKWRKHGLTTLAGAEVRQAAIQSDNSRFYGFNEENLSVGTVDYTHQYPKLVNGSYDFIQSNQYLGHRRTNFVSLFANAAYTYDQKYTLSGSVRRDASNLFGLKTNDQWNPFWSAGAAWELSKENFFPLSWLSYLKLRGSYGFNGNIDPAMIAVSTIAYEGTNSVFTNTPTARFDNYYNPKLRWETSRMINVGFDFATPNNRISGSVEYYKKKGTGLFGPADVDYTTGIANMTANVASTTGHGIDVELKTLNIDSPLKWYSTLNFSTFKDQVLQYNLSDTMAQRFIGTGYSVPVAGLINYPVYSIFAYKWAGLDPETGDPRGYLNGEISKNYTEMIGSGTAIKDLQFFGSALPTVYGSFLNSWTYQSVTLDVGLTYKLGYWIRRSSVNYTDLFNSWIGHRDYMDRWQNPGDEAVTNVPSILYENNSNRDIFYRGASVLVEKGDHIRLQYINISYQIGNQWYQRMPKLGERLSLFINLSNLGLLWKANKHEIDPDYNLGSHHLKPAMNFTFGLRAKF